MLISHSLLEAVANIDHWPFVGHLLPKHKMLPPTYVEGFHNKDMVQKMKYVPFGETGLLVSKLSQGGGCFSAIYGEFDEAEAIATVHESLKSGINYIDTAPFYGQGQSERFLGKALKDVPRKSYYIATKVCRYGKTAQDGFDFSFEKTKKSVDNSLKLLGLDYVDIIQVHDLEFAPNVDIVVNESLPALAEVLKEGKARFIGITGYPVSLLKEVLEKSNVKISSVLSYSRDTLIDDTLQDYVPYFKSRGVALISAAAPAMGLLTNQPPPVWHPAPQTTKDVCAEAARYCSEKGVELGRLAVYHNLQQPGGATCLIGMNTRELLRSNIDLLLNGLSPNEQKVLIEVKEKFFKNLKKAHWEGIEVAKYHKNLASLQG